MEIWNYNALLQTPTKKLTKLFFLSHVFVMLKNLEIIL